MTSEDEAKIVQQMGHRWAEEARRRAEEKRRAWNALTPEEQAQFAAADDAEIQEAMAQAVAKEAIRRRNRRLEGG